MLHNRRVKNNGMLALLTGCIVTALAPSSAVADDSQLVPKVITTVQIATGGFANGGSGTFWPTINTKTNRVYVANLANSTVSVIDGWTDKLIDTIAINHNLPGSFPAGFLSGPVQVAIDEDTNTIYVLTNNGTISVVDGRTDKVKSSFVVDTNTTSPEGFSTGSIVFSKRTGKLYVSNSDIQIDVIDPKKQKVITRIADDSAYALAIDQSTNTIYNVQHWDGSVFVINGYTDQVTDTITGVGRPSVPNDCYKTATCTDEGSQPDWAGVDESLHRLYVGLDGDQTTVTIDTRSNTVLKTNPIGSYSVAVDPINHAAYTINAISAVLGVINGFTDTIVANNIPAGIQYQTIPEGIAVNPVTGKIYVADFGFTAPDQVIVLKIPDDKLSER